MPLPRGGRGGRGRGPRVQQNVGQSESNQISMSECLE